MKKINFTYKGLVVPVFTPFNNDANRSLNLSVIPKYARFLQSKNITGILVNGTSGEGTSLNLEERKKLAESWSEVVKETKQHLMIQIGGTSLTDVKELAAHAEKIGADSILCLPELYFRPNNASELIEYLRIVGESAPKTPLLYYDFPRASMVNVDMKDVFESIGKRVPTFCGMKTDLLRGLLARQANDSFSIFLAGDLLMIGGCAVGVESYIMTCLNFVPEPAFELIEFAKGNKDVKHARKCQQKINDIVCTVTCYGAWVETMKVAMNLVTDIFVGPPRDPLKILSREDVENMNEGLNKIGIKTNKTSLIEMY